MSKLFADSDDEEDEEPVKKQETVAEPKSEPVEPPKKPVQAPRPSAMIQPSEESADFKNSLASLLSKGNPLAPGV